VPRRARTVIVVLATLVLASAAACGQGPEGSPEGSAGGSPSGQAASPSAVTAATPLPSATSRPEPGHEVYGFLPYWEVDKTIAAHLRSTDLTTLALFSVTNNRKGAIDSKQNGYRRITGEIGAQVIREARERGVRVDLVFTSFGRARNDGFFGDLALQGATIASLVALVEELGLDGINVDVEGLDPALVPAYGAFVGRLREALVAADQSDELSVSTSGNVLGAGMAAAAATAGVDRIFLMGYDYRVAGSEPGATSPLDRRDGDERDLQWSLDLYEAFGVPPGRTLLGLPLYGRMWPVTGPELGAPSTGPGVVWVPRRNLDILEDPAIVPVRDEIEVVELYALLRAKSGALTGPSATPLPPPSNTPAGSGGAAAASPGSWRAVYVDSPETLGPKLALANDRGLAGAGFWAIGYERGLPGYTELINRFAAGQPME